MCGPDPNAGLGACIAGQVALAPDFSLWVGKIWALKPRR